MFDVAFNAQIAKLGIKVKFDHGVVRRICKLTLARAFDDIVAAGLGKDAKDALAALKSRGAIAVTLPIGAVEANGKLVAVIPGTDGKTEEVTIGALKGIKAKGRADKDDVDAAPTIAVEFSFEWQEAAWTFLGRNAEAYIDVTLVRREVGQLELGSNVVPLRGPKGAH